MREKKSRMVKIVVPDDFPQAITGTEAHEKLKRYGELRIYNTKAESQKEFIERIKEANIVLNIRAYSKFTDEVLRSSTELKMISIWGAGTDHVDLRTARELGIVISNTHGSSTISIAEHTIALIFAVSRNIPEIHQAVKRGQWPRGYVVELYGKTLGIVGTGSIGQRVCELGKSIGMKVISWTYHPSKEGAKRLGIEFVSLKELLKRADVISVHLRLSPETEGLIGEKEFDLMKPTAIIINTARGAIIDHQALVEALREKKIAGAGIDVYPVEPISADDPLLKLDNVVLTPHSAGMTREAMDAGLNMAVDNIIQFTQGNPVRIVS